MLEARQLWRLVGWPGAGALVAFAAIARVQEPTFLRGLGVDFFWRSVDTATCLVCSTLPLLWAAGRTPAARAWTTRLAARPLQLAVVGWLGVLAVAAALAGIAAAFAYTLDSIVSGSSSHARAGTTLAKAVVATLPLAALAPALAAVSSSLTVLASTWLVVLAASVGAFGALLPAPLGHALAADSLLDLARARDIVALLCATGAGLLLSSAMSARPGPTGRRKPHANRHPR